MKGRSDSCEWLEFDRERLDFDRDRLGFGDALDDDALDGDAESGDDGFDDPIGGRE
jgi:hypothetical protein